MLTFLMLVVFPAVMVPGYTVNDCPASLPRDHYLQVFGDSCFQFVLYRQRDYFQAESDCENQGGTLALIKSPDIQNFLHNQLRSTYRSDHSTYEEVWIGLHDDMNENHFEWEDGTAAVYSNWGSGEGPSNWLDYQSEDCISMSTYSGKWKDHPCVSDTDYVFTFFPVTSHVEYPYICQYRAGTTMTAKTTEKTTGQALATTVTSATSSTTKPTPASTTTTKIGPISTTITPPLTITKTASTHLETSTKNLTGHFTTTSQTQAFTNNMSGAPTTAVSSTTSKSTTTARQMTTAFMCPPFQCYKDCPFDEYARNEATGCLECRCPNQFIRK